MEYPYIIWGMWGTIALIAVIGFALFAFAAVAYVAFHFLSLVVSMQTALVREFKSHGTAVDKALGDIPDKESKLKDFIRARMAPTEGDFQAYNDEEAFIQEQVVNLRGQGLTPEELDAFVRQAVADSTDGKTLPNSDNG